MYSYIPVLLWCAGRMIVNGIGKQSQAANQAAGEKIKYDDALRSPPPDPRRVQETDLYGGNPFRLAVGLMAKLAKADGVVTKGEVQVVESIFSELGAVGEIRQQAIAIFQTAKDGPLTFLDVLAMYRQQTCEVDEVVRRDLILMLLWLAHADGGALSHQAEQLIRSACSSLDADYRQCLDAFQTWRQAAADTAAQAQVSQIKLAYEILGCSPADGEEHLRHRYRQLVRDFHPDTIAGKGLSPEFTRFAEEKFKQIQAAYELLAVQHR